MFLVINNIYKFFFFDARKKLFCAPSIALDSSSMYANKKYYPTDCIRTKQDIYNARTHAERVTLDTRERSAIIFMTTNIRVFKSYHLPSSFPLLVLRRSSS